MILQTPSFSISEKKPEPEAKSPQAKKDTTQPEAEPPEKRKSTEQAAESPERQKGSSRRQIFPRLFCERKKGCFQIIKETLQELRQPGAWLRYTKEIVAGAAGQAAGKEEKGQQAQAAEQAKKSGGKRKFWHALQKPSFWINVALLIILALVLASIYL